MLSGIFAGYPDWARASLAAVFVLALAYLIAELVSRVVGRLVARVDQVPDGPAPPEGETVGARPHRTGLRAIRLVVTLLVGLVLIFPALSMVGLRSSVGLTPEHLGNWAAGSGLRIALILLLGWLLIHVADLVVRRMQAAVDPAGTIDVLERAKRAQTLGALLHNAIYVLVSSVALLMILRELSVDITPILTGAGIVGLAVGFGAQSLVKDIISGFFLILEDQIRVGDVANIDGTGGLVERITLRTIILRDERGTVHVIPNGSIQRLSNQTKDFSYYVASVAVAYREDTDRVTRVLIDIADQMRRESAVAPFMLEGLDVLGVDRFGESSVEIKVRIKTVPSKQWTVGREFLRRIKQAFDDEGIEIPFPHRQIVVTQGGLPGEPPAAAPVTATPPRQA